MTHSSLASLLDLELTPGEPPLVRADAGTPDGAGAANWAAGHRNALRAAVAEHGCVLVRGLGLRAAAAPDGCSGLRAAVLGHAGAAAAASEHAPRAELPAEFPGLLLFACLSPAASGGDTALAAATAVLEALPADLVQRFEREGWILDRANAIEFAWHP